MTPIPTQAEDLVLVPREPTTEMLIAARDWSDDKYGKPIGNDAARACYRVMISAVPSRDQGGNSSSQTSPSSEVFASLPRRPEGQSAFDEEERARPTDGHPDATDLYEAMEAALVEGTPTLSLQAGRIWLDEAAFDAHAILHHLLSGASASRKEPASGCEQGEQGGAS